MNLTPPSKAIFIISVILAALVILVKYFGFGVPVVNARLFETLLVAYVVLLAGVLVRGL